MATIAQDHTYQFRPKDNIEATDRFLVYDKNNLIRPIKAAAFADLPERETPQTGDTILAVDEDGNLFRIDPVDMATITVGDFQYNFVNGILVEVIDNS